MRIVFFNISYMDYYKGKYNDKMIGNFRYVKEKGDGGEKHNFEPLFLEGKEVCYGFVEPGFTEGGYEKGRQRQMYIEKIDEAAKPKEKIENVLAVWCAKLPESNKTVIVGWYKNATVYRVVNLLPYNKDTDRGLPEFGYWYNVIADKCNCVLLPTEERIKERWRAYRKNQNSEKFGFGQSNMWYAREDSAKNYVLNIIRQVEAYNGVNWV